MVPAAVPDTFEDKVRRPGLDAIAELVGESPGRRRRGPRRKRRFTSREQIPADAFPDYWCKALPDLRRAYRGLCAYLGLYLHHATGNASVDHFVPKSKDWRLVYEWSNYRLCAAQINGHRGNRELLLDPFTIEPGMFALELVGFQVIPGPEAHGAMGDIVKRTICDLGLNQRGCWKDREEYVAAYNDGSIALEHLERHAPFVAGELRHQGLLVRGDT
ncbi:MAG TPA: hypothetical protein VFK02_10590 [Kofleriaceae bacterium]|nr:hypothetical protein [Kofleriaceae bacterium]